MKLSGKRDVAEGVLIAVLSAAGVKLVEYIAERIEEKRRARTAATWTNGSAACSGNPTRSNPLESARAHVAAWPEWKRQAASQQKATLDMDGNPTPGPGVDGPLTPARCACNIPTAPKKAT